MVNLGRVARAPLQREQVLRIAHGQRLQHDGVYDAENRGIGTDAQRQRQQRHGSEAGILFRTPNRYRVSWRRPVNADTDPRRRKSRVFGGVLQSSHARLPPAVQLLQLAAPAIDKWKEAALIAEGALFRSINKAGRVWGTGMTPKVLWEVVRAAATRAGIEKLAPHDLRRSCATLCHLAGGELDQIQFLLGHVSIQTTERYLGCKQKLRSAVNDRMGIEPDGAPASQ